MNRIVVTGLGAVTPLGVGARHSWNALLNNQSGIVSTSSWGPKYAALPSQVAGVVPKGKKKDGGWDVEEWVTKEERRKAATFTHYALAAAQEALEDAEWLPRTEEEREKTGVCLGSGIGNIDVLEEQALAYEKGGYHKIHPLFVPRILINLGASHISMRWGLKGPSLSPTSACTTGAHSLISAYQTLLPASSPTKLLLAGSSDSTISPLSLAGFARAQSLSTLNQPAASASRPFDATRSGFVLAEGAAILCLETLEHALTRNARIYAEMVGYGLSSDAHHVTAPRADGAGATRAMRDALIMANAKPEDVGWVNAHATGTVLGDRAENRAIEALVGIGKDADPGSGTQRFKGQKNELLVTSQKGATGHTLGASGAVEALFSVLGLKEEIVPATRGFDKAAEGDGFGFEYLPGEKGAREKEWKSGEVVVSNSFGFGGGNASLVFRRWTG